MVETTIGRNEIAPIVFASSLGPKGTIFSVSSAGTTHYTYNLAGVYGKANGTALNLRIITTDTVGNPVRPLGVHIQVPANTRVDYSPAIPDKLAFKATTGGALYVYASSDAAPTVPIRIVGWIDKV